VKSHPRVHWWHDLSKTHIGRPSCWPTASQPRHMGPSLKRVTHPASARLPRIICPPRASHPLAPAMASPSSRLLEGTAAPARQTTAAHMRIWRSPHAICVHIPGPSSLAMECSIAEAAPFPGPWRSSGCDPVGSERSPNRREREDPRRAGVLAPRSALLCPCWPEPQNTRNQSLQIARPCSVSTSAVTEPLAEREWAHRAGSGERSDRAMRPTDLCTSMPKALLSRMARGAFRSW
jgi:hypothetical protein